jgi:hypothetical protein
MLQLPEEGSARVVFPMGLATLTIVAAAVRFVTPPFSSLI